MSGLFASLTMAGRSLQAQLLGLDTVGRNISNAATPGYSRQEVVFAAVPPAESWSGGGGVKAVRLTAARDMLIEQRIRLEVPMEMRDQAIVRQLGLVETVLGSEAPSVSEHLTSFFDAWAVLAEDPTSTTARIGVLSEAQSLANAFHDTAGVLTAGRMDADAGIRTAASEVNALAARLAELNRQLSISVSNDAAAIHLEDEIGVVLESMSRLVDIDTVRRQDGGFDVSIASGRPLVVGASAFAIEIGRDAAGMTSLSCQGFEVTGEIAGGEIGGLIQIRDKLLPDYLGRLDRLAAALCEQVNTLHQAGFDLDGTAGGAFFVPPVAVEGAASSMQVEAAIGLDPRRIAAAGSATAGDNGTARALAALAHERVAGDGATFAEAWANFVYATGRDLQSARDDQQSRELISRQLFALRDAVSGVSLDEEALMMTRFQRAYEANARYFTVIDSAIQTLMQMVRA